MIIRHHGQTQPIMLGGAKPPILCRVRPDRPKPEAQRAVSGGGVLEEGAASPLPTSYVGGTVSFPSGVQGRAPAAKRVSCILEVPDSLSWNLLVPSLASYDPLSPPKIQTIILTIFTIINNVM